MSFMYLSYQERFLGGQVFVYLFQRQKTERKAAPIRWFTARRPAVAGLGQVEV